MEPNSIPLEDAGLSEVLARVAFRLIEIDYRQNPMWYDDPVDAIQALAVFWSDAGAVCIPAFLGSYAREKQRKPHLLLRFIRAAMIERTRTGPGLTWRQIAFPEYKANRRWR